MKIFSYFLLVLGVLCIPVFALAKTPNDPYFAQWSFEHTGVYKAWDYSTGSKDVVVAIIDNGFDSFHPDLRDNLWVNNAEIPNNNIDDDNNGYVDDYYGWNFLDHNNNPRPNVDNLTASQKEDGVFNHATVIAGIIGAKGNNGLDGAGINWNVSLMNLKVIGNDGSGDFGPLVNAIYYAVDNGADVINISVVGDGDEGPLQKAVDYAYKNGVFVVAAAGNNRLALNYSPQYPVCSDVSSGNNEVLGVSAIEESHHLAIFSNIGSNCIDITAPGVDIHSTLRFSPTNGLADSYSVNKGWNGTSFSAPFVTGAIALIKSVKPNFTNEQIINTIFSTVHHTPNDDEKTYADLFGVGLLQIDKAMASISNISDIQTPAQENVPVDSTLEKMSVVLVSSNLSKKELVANKIQENISDFVGIEDAFLLQDFDGNFQNITLSTDSDHKKMVKFFDDKLSLLNKIKINLEGDYDLAVGYINDSKNINYSKDLKIVLAPKFSSNIYLYVFDINGNLVNTYKKDSSHDGVSVYIGDGYLDVAYVKGYKTYVEILDSNFVVLNSFETNKILVGQIMSLDLDRDGNNEYILASSKNSSAWIRVFSSDGIESYNINVYPSSYRKGFNFAVADYDLDGNLDFVFTPKDSETPLRVMTLSGNFLNESYPFAGANYGQVFTMLTQK